MRAGVMYYFSHPPLAYDLPYLMFAGLGIAPNVLGLQLFNMLFHLLTTVCLYLLVKELHTSEAASRAPLFAAVLYLFMPAPLWFHSNAYMSDMFVQNFWVMHLVVVARIFKRGEFDSWRSLGLLCATTFLTMYTSWPGVFAAMAVTVLACRHWWATRDRACFKPAVVAWVAVCLALGLALWRYLHVVDLDSLMLTTRAGSPCGVEQEWCTGLGGRSAIAIQLPHRLSTRGIGGPVHWAHTMA
ncbi:MAG: glycosyltransferase family 39 protein [Flavobacteriales bacterium]|nr:glycosyltransferase family 39 protein [Flavobacteriales bacterium]